MVTWSARVGVIGSNPTVIWLITFSWCRYVKTRTTFVGGGDDDVYFDIAPVLEPSTNLNLSPDAYPTYPTILVHRLPSKSIF
jgi:hypothetical protein